MQTQNLTCFAPDGSTFDWRRLEVRVPEFLNAYPPSAGWKVEYRHAHLLDTSPALLELAKIALTQGKDLQLIGITSAELSSFVYEARLINPDGQVVRNASARAVAPSVRTKSWESGETAAFNRLLAVLGFGGGVLDLDEASDRTVQGITVSASPSPGASSSASDGSATTSAAPQGSAASLPALPGAVHMQTLPSGGGKRRSAKGVTSTQLEDKGVSKQVHRLVLQQVNELTKVGLKIELPELASDAQARAFLVELESRRTAHEASSQQAEEPALT